MSRFGSALVAGFVQVTLILQLSSRINAQCDGLAALSCFGGASAYYNRLKNLDFAFNAFELTQLCAVIDQISSCLPNYGCQPDDVSLFSPWPAVYNITQNICNSPGMQEYLSYEACYETTPLKGAVAQCINQTSIINYRYATYDSCLLGRAKVRCVSIGAQRVCGAASTQYLVRLLTPLLQTDDGSCDLTGVQGYCNATSLSSCVYPFTQYLNVLSGPTTVQFSRLSTFNSVCGFVEWVSACLQTYGCTNSSTDAAVTQKWTNFHDPLEILCFQPPPVALNSFNATGTGCNNSGACQTIGTTATFTSNCPNGFTLNTAGSKCGINGSDKQSSPHGILLFLSFCIGLLLIGR